MASVIHDYQSITPSNVNVAHGVQTTLASLTLDKGVYIVTGYHQWNSAFTDRYTDYIGDFAVRNLSGQNGGGNCLSRIINITSDNTTFTYSTYLYGTADNTAVAISLQAIKIK